MTGMDLPQTRSAARIRAAEQSRAEKQSRAAGERGLLYFLGTALSAVLLLAVAGIAALVIVVPLVVGGQALTVLTNSMAPGLPPGTLIVIRPVNIDDVLVGDVITYQIESGKPDVVTHRVVERTVNLEGETTLVTMGDNNDLADDPIQEVQVRGKLMYAVPWIGWVNNVITGEMRMLAVPIVAGLLFAYALWMVFGGIRDRRRKADSVP